MRALSLDEPARFFCAESATCAGVSGSGGGTLREVKLLDVRGFGFGMVLVLTATLGCNPHEETRFESNVQLVSRRDVTLDAKGVVTADFELEWDPCPGDQYQYVRGSREFSACMSKYDKGDYLAVKVRHYWDTRGFYRWDVFQVGDCPRDADPDVEGSYERSQECSDHKAYGESGGFDCNRRTPKRLAKVCPWLSRN